MKKLLLKISVVVIVLVFLGTSFISANSQNDHVFPSNLVGESNQITPMASGSGDSAPFIGYVNNTLLPWNNTLLRGNVVNTGNSEGEIGVPVIDKATGNIYVIISSGRSYYLDLVNISTNMVTKSILLSLPFAVEGYGGGGLGIRFIQWIYLCNVIHKF